MRHFKQISAAAAARRDLARDTDGQFGTQQHADSGIVDDDSHDQYLTVPPGFTTVTGGPITVNYSVSDHDVVQQWTRPTPSGEQILTLMRDGGQLYTVDGHTHRTDGPAVAYPDGRREYAQHGKRHRTDGPAVINYDGTEEFWLEGHEVAPIDMAPYQQKRRRLSKWV